MSKYGSLDLIEDGELVESDEEQVTLEETVNWQTIHSSAGNRAIGGQQNC